MLQKSKNLSELTPSLHGHLSTNSAVWAIRGSTNPSGVTPPETNKTYADCLNKHFSRFESGLPSGTPSGDVNASMLLINVEDVENSLAKLNYKKSPGPDGIIPQAVMRSAAQLAHIITQLFNISLESGTVPTLWKTGHVTPIPKPHQ